MRRKKKQLVCTYLLINNRSILKDFVVFLNKMKSPELRSLSLSLSAARCLLFPVASCLLLSLV